MARISLEDLKRMRPIADRSRLDATSEAEISRHAREDGETLNDPAPYRDVLPPALIRRRLGMTQAQFAKALRIPLATLRNWEQGRVAPDPAARALLMIVARNPEAALAALAA